MKNIIKNIISVAIIALLIGGSVFSAESLISIYRGGTGASTAQQAINNLTQVSGATNEHVLTKDTSTGNAIWKAGTVYPSAGIPLSTGSSWETSITNNSSNWNTAYGWGNHASAGYLTSLSGALLATGATTGATSQAQVFTNGLKTNKIYPGSDSTTAFQFNRADGTTNVFNVDTTNYRIGIRTTSPENTLDVRGTVSIGAASGGSTTLTSNIADATRALINLRDLSSGDMLFTPALIGSAQQNSIFSAGNVGIKEVNPTAYLHLKAGTTAANNAPLKFNAGTNMTNAEAGAIEWDGTNLFATQTTGPTRKTLAYTDSNITGTAANSSLLENHNAAYFQVAGNYLTSITADSPLSGAGTSASHLTVDLSSKQNASSALTSIAGLSWSSGSPLVKMTAAGTFGLDSTAYLTAESDPKVATLTSGNFCKGTGTQVSCTDSNTYLTSLSGAVLTDQTSGQTIGATGARLTKLWATDITVSNPITGSITGNAGSVTNATFTTALTNNGGAGTLTWPVEGATLTIPTGGGTLGTAAFTAATAYEASGGIATHAALTATHGVSGAIVGTSDSQTLSNKSFGAGMTWPTFNQNTTGSAATLTTPRNINGVAFNGSGNITVPSDIAPSTSGNLMISNGTVWTSAAVPTWNQNTTGSAATLTTARTIGGVSFNGSANITVASATGGFTVSGGNLALGANNLTMTGSIGATGARITKGWFTDLEVTNPIAGSVTGNAGTVTGLSVTSGKTLTLDTNITASGIVSYINVAKYGILPSASAATNTSGWATLIAAIPAGSTIYFPAGHYDINNNLAVNVACSIIGDGDSTIIHQNTTTKGVFDGTVSGISISKIKLIGYGSATYAAGAKAIYIHGADSAHYLSNIKIKDVSVSTFENAGIYLLFVKQFEVTGGNFQTLNGYGIAGLSVLDGMVSNNYVYNIIGGLGSGQGYGIILSHETPGSDPISERVTVDSNIVDTVPTWEAYDTHAGKKITFSNNISRNAKIGFNLAYDSDNSRSVIDCNLINNIIDSGLTNGTADVGIYFAGASSSILATGSIVGNTIRGYGDETNVNSGGIVMANTQGLAVTGNVLKDPAPGGIRISGGNHGFTVSGNSIIDPWTNSVGVGNAIGIWVAGVNAGYIGENSINHDASPSGKSATYLITSAGGIGIYISNDASDIQIGGNYSNATNKISDSGSHARTTFDLPINVGTMNISVGLVPDANDGAYLGTSALGWSDLFLADGGVINLGGGDITLTQSANLLTLAGGDFSLGANNLKFTGSLAYNATTIDGAVQVTNGFIRLNSSTDTQYQGTYLGNLTGESEFMIGIGGKPTYSSGYKITPYGTTASMLLNNASSWNWYVNSGLTAGTLSSALTPKMVLSTTDLTIDGGLHVGGTGTAGDNNLLVDGTINTLTLTSQSTGFTIAGGTTSKTLTLNDNLSASTTPVISTGSGAPGTTPGKVGNMYIDTSGKKLYIATGTSSSSDWTITN